MKSPFDEPAYKPRTTSGWKSWSTKKKILILSGALLLAIGIGLGVGLGLGLRGGDEGHEDEERPPTHPPTGNYTGWQPEVGTSWQIELLHPLRNASFDADVYDIDLETNPKSTIADLHSMGRKVICYFSAGTYENWRPEKGKFKSADLGKALEDWPKEKWVDTNSQNVRDIMAARLDMAESKGCDGVDPDNVDAYDNDNGLGLTQSDAIDYVNWLAGEAHARNLSIGLKNAGDIIDSVIKGMQWSVNEQCAQYEECETYDAFPQAGKPVFHIEYPKGDSTNNEDPVSAKQLKSACDFPDAKDFSTIIKNMNLDDWVELC